MRLVRSRKLTTFVTPSSEDETQSITVLFFVSPATTQLTRGVIIGTEQSLVAQKTSHTLMARYAYNAQPNHALHRTAARSRIAIDGSGRHR
jgi:hypothetical protein